MKTVLLAIHLVVAIVLISCILLQTSKGGLGSAFGGTGMYHTKRGAERLIFITTVVSALLFLSTSIINFLIR